MAGVRTAASAVATTVDTVAANTAHGTADAASAATAAAKTVDPPPSPPSSNPGGGWNGATGVVSVMAAVSTFGLSMFSSFRDVLSKDRPFDPSQVLGPMSALFAGASLLLLAQRGTFGAGPGTNFVRGGALTLMGAGVVAAAAGATNVFNPNRPTPGSANPNAATTRQFTPSPVTSVAQLEGFAVASARAWTTERDVAYMDVYLDPTTATRVPAGVSPIDAMRYAQAAAQVDPDDRSFALVQTVDGGLWTVRLTGDMDQIDGRNYDDGNKLDRLFMNRLELDGKHPSVLGIAGVQRFAPFEQRPAPAPAPDEGAPIVPELFSAAGTSAAASSHPNGAVPASTPPLSGRTS